MREVYIPRRRGSRDDLNAYVRWLSPVPWQLFGTFTFAWPVSDPQADQVFSALINHLERSFRCPIAYVRGDEKRFSGCGRPAAPRHYHALLVAAVRLDANFVEKSWMRMAGFRANGVGAKVCVYDPRGNAIRYCLKLIFQPDGDWQFKNLDLFLSPPDAVINRRWRRRLARQEQRVLQTGQSMTELAEMLVKMPEALPVTTVSEQCCGMQLRLAHRSAPNPHRLKTWPPRAKTHDHVR
jgi:hypothetical protein